MTACELATCSQEDIKVNVAIIKQRLFWAWFVSGSSSSYGGPLRSDAHQEPRLREAGRCAWSEGHPRHKREEVQAAVEAARSFKETCIIDFRVEQEDSVYPMVPAGATWTT